MYRARPFFFTPVTPHPGHFFKHLYIYIYIFIYVYIGRLFASNRYIGEVGDLVVGRVSEVQSRRWTVEVRVDARVRVAVVESYGQG